MVDATVSLGQITPVWHCSGCGKSFAGRTYEAEQTLQRNYSYPDVTVSDSSGNARPLTGGDGVLVSDGTGVSLDVEFIKAEVLKMQSWELEGSQFSQGIKDQAMQGIKGVWGQKLEWNPEIQRLDGEVKEIKVKFDKLLRYEEERRADPLNDLRERVSKFKLC